MVEHPEAVTLAKQLNTQLKGSRISKADTGTSPHKWVFYWPSREELVERLEGKTIGHSKAVGRSIRIDIGHSRRLILDEFGGKVQYHEAGRPKPKTYHLLIAFEDDSFLTVAIQGWGFIGVSTEKQHLRRLKGREGAISATDRALTQKRFVAFIDNYEDKGKDSIKTFFTNGRSVAGIGNGYLQDILFRARVDPRRKVVDIRASEKKALYRGLKETMKEAVSLGGRECERDLLGEAGRYRPLMDRNTAGKPCPECKTKIVKMSYLGGSCYLCPKCQK
jgi:formamidopyrimidine-DNA glycosylase